MKENKAFYLGFFSLFSFFSCIIFILKSLRPELVNYPTVWISQAFFFIILMISHLLSSQGLKKGNEFSTFYMASMGFRFLMSLIYLFLVVYLYIPSAWVVVINFFVLYLVYTSFEIYSLMANLGPKIKSDRTVSKKLLFIGIILSLFVTFNGFANPEQHEAPKEIYEEEEFKPGEMIMHHIADSHEWHFATIGHTHLTIPLPVMLYNRTTGQLDVFSSSKFHDNHGEYDGYKLEGHHIVDAGGDKIIDFSITKNVASLLISAALLLGIFLTISARYKSNALTAPKGIQSFFEPIIIYIRDDVAKMAIGPKYEKYMPYLLTVFFFIWFNNLLGILPGGANLTGNIAVTFCLAIMTFIITTFSGNKYYWGHVFNPPGVPHLFKIIIVPIEIVGLFTKPFSLMVRLFANITAGHIIILSLLGLIFIFKSVGASLISIPFALFMNFLELFVAILQAYIFTLLSAMYFGGAIEEHADHDHGIGYDGDDHGHAH